MQISLNNSKKKQKNISQKYFLFKNKCDSYNTCYKLKNKRKKKNFF